MYVLKWKQNENDVNIKTLHFRVNTVDFAVSKKQQIEIINNSKFLVAEHKWAPKKQKTPSLLQWDSQSFQFWELNIEKDNKSRIISKIFLWTVKWTVYNMLTLVKLFLNWRQHFL